MNATLSRVKCDKNRHYAPRPAFINRSRRAACLRECCQRVVRRFNEPQPLKCINFSVEFDERKYFPRVAGEPSEWGVTRRLARAMSDGRRLLRERASAAIMGSVYEIQHPSVHEARGFCAILTLVC